MNFQGLILLPRLHIKHGSQLPSSQTEERSWWADFRARRLLREGALAWGPEGPLTENCVQLPCLGPRLTLQLALPLTLALCWLFDCIRVKHLCMSVSV